MNRYSMIAEKIAASRPMPKFQLGDRVQIMDGRRVMDEGEVSFNSGYDDYVGQWKYKVKTQYSRVTYSESSLRKIASILTADMEDAIPVADPIDVAAQYTANIGKELLRLRGAYGITGIRQNYRGTGSQRARRQLFIRLGNDDTVDVWLDMQGYQIGGVTLLRMPGRFPYDNKTPADIAREIMEKLKTLAKVASVKTASVTFRERLEAARRMIESGGRGVELGIREISYLADNANDLYKHLRLIQESTIHRGTSEEQEKTDLLYVLKKYVGD